MKTITLGLSAIALALTGAAAWAQDHAMPPEPSQTRAEAQAMAAAAFDKLDLNHDGKLDKADHALRLRAMFDRIDANHDGMISPQEFMAMHEHMGGHGMDEPKMGDPAMRSPGMDHGKGGGHGGMGHERHHRELLMAILQRADPGHTGMVTRDGFVGAALQLFDIADANHDGVLTPDERHAADKMLGEKMREHRMREHGMGGPGMGGPGMGGQGMEGSGGAPMGDRALPPPPPANPGQ